MRLIVSVATTAVSLCGFAVALSFHFSQPARAQQTSSPSNSTTAQSPPQSNPLVAPLFLQDDRFSSVLTMVNEAKATLSAQLILRDGGGVIVAQKKISLSGHTSQTAQLADLLANVAEPVPYGSLTLIPEASQAMMPIAAQLSITGGNASEPTYLDSELMMAGMARSTTLAGVALEATGAIEVGVHNISAMPRKEREQQCDWRQRSTPDPDSDDVRRSGRERLRGPAWCGRHGAESLQQFVFPE